MRILMLGNSFTFYNDLPSILASKTGAEVVSHARGGARLAEQLNPETKMGLMTQKALQTEHWDYVILQEMSSGPITSPASFFRSVSQLCEIIRSAGAQPILYATWAYQPNSDKMNSFQCSYDEMYQALLNAYHKAGIDNDAIVADVGKAFYENAPLLTLYAEDGIHPNITGTHLAAQIIADSIS